MEDKEIEKISQGVEKCFIERIKNTISEKISDCVSMGMSEDEACYVVTQIVKNLPDNLLPLKNPPREVCGEEMLLVGHCNTSSGKKFPEWPPEDVNDED